MHLVLIAGALVASAILKPLCPWLTAWPDGWSGFPRQGR